MEDNRKIFIVHNLGIINLTKYKGKLKTMSCQVCRNHKRLTQSLLRKLGDVLQKKKKKVAENQESELKATISGLKTIVL